MTQTVTLPGWISGVDQIKQKVTTSLAEAFHTREENGLTATCPAGYVSTVPRNQLIQRRPVNKKLRQRGKKLVAMGFGCLWMLLRESICHSSEELIFAEVLTGRTYCAKQQQQQQLQKNPPPSSPNQLFHYRILKSDVSYVRRWGEKKKNCRVRQCHSFLMQISSAREFSWIKRWYLGKKEWRNLPYVKMFHSL